MTISARLIAAREQLRAAGIPADDADLSARLLAQNLLGWDAARLLASASEEEPSDFPAPYGHLVARRAAREPLAYITGQREFWNLTFEVTPAVFIPRPETELLMEIALERCPDRTAALVIADVCTGSGCLAVCLAHDYPRTRLFAADVSAAALEVARRNAMRHGVEDRVTFLQTDLLEGFDDACDLIVANPPYVPNDVRPALQPEVRDYEPEMALFGGADGLAIVRRLIEQSVARLKPRALLVFEFGLGQAEVVSSLISSTPGLTLMELRQDLQGIPRAAVARNA